MDLAALLGDQLERLFVEHVDRNCLHAAESGIWPAALWSAAEDFGLRTALVAEAAGGSGLSWTDAGAILRRAGRFAAPIPLGETMIAAALLSRAGIAIPEGVLTFADGRALAVDDGLLEGRLPAVAWAHAASHMVVAAGPETDTRLCLIDLDQVETRPLRTTGRDARDDVVLRRAKPVATAPLDGAAAIGILELGALMRASQIAGALRRVLELAVDYANTRQQFGRPIGRFQAIQQSLAQLAAEVAAAEVASAAGWRARDKAEAGLGDPGYEAAVARIRCSEAARLGAAIVHQVHGAIGVTDEHMLHYFTRRLWLWRLEFGAEAWWAEELGAKVLAAGGDQLWPLLTRDDPA